MPRYYVWTIGCQMNKAESERLAGGLESLGYQLAGAADDADLIILNSCVVRGSAEVKVINKLDALKTLKKEKPGTVLALTGCLVNSDTAELARSFPHVDHFFKPGELPPFLGEAKPTVTVPRPRVSVYIPIIQGCNNFCSYCIVPYRRGREKSRAISEIACEVGELARRGAREVTLLGQNVDSYGHDLPGKPHLADLLAELNSIEGLARIRFLTNHPKDMDARLIEAMARLDKVCEQLTLPVQSGSDAILKAMRRGYTVEQYRELVARVRSYLPRVALGTDVIVGFPTESEEQFQETFNLLSAERFDKVHVAAYSPRPGTIAAREMNDDVPARVKKERLGRIEALQQGIATEINAGMLGKPVGVLVEDRVKDKWRGRSRTDKLVFFKGDSYPGQLVEVEISKTSPWSLQGNVHKQVKEVIAAKC